MSELCERCGWPKMVKDAPDWKLRCWWNFPDEGDSPLACLLRAHEREKARAEEAERDRDAWKRTAEVRAALLEGDDKPFREEIVDAQKDAAAAIARADRYEAEFCACKALLIAAEARGVELRAALTKCLEWFTHDVESGAYAGGDAWKMRDLCARALAALPVESARRQVPENANALGAPAAQSPAMPEEER